MAALVNDVEIEDHLDVAAALNLGDRFPNGDVFVQREDIGVHDAARGSLGVLEQVLDDARLLRAHQVENRGGQFLRQVVDQGRGIVRRDVLREFRDFLSRSSRQERGARFRAQLGDGLHGQAAVPIGQHGERGLAFLVLKLAEDLREVGRMLFLEKIQEVGGRTDAQQSPD